ncbi:MAG: ABC transporter ATP-binding protein [Coxiellaceae bacterium]|jgi:putative hydroxymethylpyrimidine transport system ATP-binding protein|nr:ABC transporter ATP-binding protein [Coxiellaceae bacterium]
MPTPSITISNFNLSYQHKLLFSNFDFYLVANQWTCILGQSGIGKTSLLRFIAGLPYGEGVKYSGHISTSDNKLLHSRLAFLSQQDSLLPWLNVTDNILLGYRLRRKKITNYLKEKVIALLEKVGLQQEALMKPRQLSQGMRQKVVLIRTLVENRNVILMDEPFSSLDVITKLKLQDLSISLLCNCTVLLVTHDPVEALRLGHRIFILNNSPAKISNIIKPHGVIPRDITDVNLLKEHTKILQNLA